MAKAEAEPEEMDAETRAWLDAYLTTPLEPYEWGPGEELEGVPFRYLPGEGWVVGEDKDEDDAS